jgi:hypothetical protein
MRNNKLQKAGLAFVLAAVAGYASATEIVRDYTAVDVACGSGISCTSGGEVKFNDDFTGEVGQQLKIDIDNTTKSLMVGTPDLNDAAITGIVFDIAADISTATIASFKDGDGNTISGWEVALNVDNNITPGHTIVDVSFTTTNGINGGIYNADDPGDNLNNLVPDVASLILDITAEDANGNTIPWLLTGISNDILRMQRVGLNGAGSLKIYGGPPDGPPPPPPEGSVPEPGIAMLLGMGLAGVGVSRFRRRQRASA